MPFCTSHGDDLDTKNHLTIFGPQAKVKLADYTYGKDKERCGVLTKIFNMLIIVLVSLTNHNFN